MALLSTNLIQNNNLFYTWNFFLEGAKNFRFQLTRNHRLSHVQNLSFECTKNLNFQHT